MSQFWTEPWSIVEASRKLEIAHEQNHRYLEIGGEPCYLLKRRQTGIPVASIPTSASIEPDPILPGYYRIPLWQEGQQTDRYPKFDTVEIFVDGVEWTRIYSTNLFEAGATEFAVEEYRDRVDPNGDDIPDAAYAILNTPPFDPIQLVTYNFTTIAQAVSQESIQPVRVDDPKTGRSIFGYDQYINPTVFIRGRNWPHTFLLGFPNVPRDLSLIPAGLQIESLLRHWTQAPPYSPEIDEHDVIIRTTNLRRYEITNMEKITHAGLIIQQQFDITEVNPDAPEYNLEYVTV